MYTYGLHPDMHIIQTYTYIQQYFSKFRKNKQVSAYFSNSNMVVQASNPNTWKQRQADLSLKTAWFLQGSRASQGYMVRSVSYLYHSLLNDSVPGLFIRLCSPSLNLPPMNSTNLFVTGSQSYFSHVKWFLEKVLNMKAIIYMCILEPKRTI